MSGVPSAVNQPTPLSWPRYGVDVVDRTSSEQLAPVSEAGATSIRIYVAWSSIEPGNTTPSNFHWASTDTRLLNARDMGLEPVVLIHGCPAWACYDYNGPIDLVSLTEFREFIVALATRYSPAPYNTHRWEFFNEPDGTRGPNGAYNWGRHGELYAALLRTAVPEMRRVDPQTTIALGGIAYDWFTTDTPTGPFYQPFLRDVLLSYQLNIDIRPAVMVDFSYERPLPCSPHGRTTIVA